MIQYSFFIRNHDIPSIKHLLGFLVSLTKKILFALIIVLGYGYDYFQMGALLFITAVSLLYKLMYNPYDDKFELSMSSMSDLMMIGALSSKIQDFKTFQSLLQTTNITPEMITAWIQKGWITVAFEVLTVFFNLTIIFGEILLHLKTIGVWFKSRFGFLLFGGDDDDETDDTPIDPN